MTGVLKAKVGGVWVPIVGSGMSAETARWNSAWGIVAYGPVTAAQTGIAASNVDITGASVTFTPVAGRRYKTTFSVMVLSTIAAGNVAHVVPQIVDSTLTVIQQRNCTYTSGGLYSHAYLEVIESGLPAVATLRKARLSITSGTVDTVIGGNYPAFLCVEDVGPAIYNPAPTPPQTPGAWTNLTLLNGWVNAGGIHPVAQYRLLGDKVELRGRILNGTMNAAMFNLPVGFRPATITTLGTPSADGSGWHFGVIEVSQDGNTAAYLPATSQAVILNNLSFSTTP